MERALSYITVLPETQSEIKTFAEMLLSEVDGEKTLPLLSRLTAIEKLVKLLKDGLKDQLIQEASMYTGEGKSFEVQGTRFTMNEGRKTYHYRHCRKWRELTEQIEAIEKHMQIGEWVDPDTGEIVPPANVSYSEPFISVTIPK